MIAPADAADSPQLDVEYPGLAFFNGRMDQADLDILPGELTRAENIALILKVIGEENISPRLAHSLDRAIRGELPSLAQLGTTAAMGGALVAIFAREILLGREMPAGRYTSSVPNMLGRDPY